MGQLPDTVKEHKKHHVDRVNFFAIIVSTTRYNELQGNLPSTDKTMDVIAELVAERGYTLVGQEVVPDDQEIIGNTVASRLADDRVDVVITSGGTGISPKDRTVEAMQGAGYVPLPGFGELFRHLSFKDVGTASMLSRSEAFLTPAKCVFCLPGSPKAVRLALSDIIIPEVEHVLTQLRKRE